MKQTRPFHATISRVYKKSLLADAAKTGVHRGIFFDTSGKVRCERINPNAQYSYVWRTDQGETP